MSEKLPVIGIFDSGLGGLTVVKALFDRCRGFSLIYFGDTARFPYGTKSADTIIRYAVENSSFLMDQGADTIIIACNTATSVAHVHIQSSFPVPVYGVIAPAAARAAAVTTSGNIGVIGTKRTIQSSSYTNAILSHRPDARVTALACPLLVSLIEDGAPSEEIKKLVVREYLRPLRQQNIDTLLLGCTHYPMIASLIQEEMGNSVTIVDPAQALADVIAPMLPSLPDAAAATYRFFTSDDAERFAAIGETFLGIKMGMVLNKRTG